MEETDINEPNKSEKGYEPEVPDPSLRSPARAGIFFASLIIMTMGVSGVIEGAYLFFKSEVLVQEKSISQIDIFKASAVSFLSGLAMVATAVGTIKLTYIAWKVAWVVLLVFLSGSAYGSYLFYGYPLSFGSLVHFFGTVASLLLLFAARSLFQSSTD